MKLKNEWNELKNITSKIVDADFTKTDTDPKPEEVLIKTNKLLKDADLLTRLYTEYNNINQKD